ncbi:hypothetical protein HanRHA438_Chr09g0400711 [Helianthus annuus]|nr:hypothetical protein HanIR_Chr09g0419551 [Helianthus annuus]KAJ0888316.1 hypothetical protein HanRHA438_Chr09g0400711 [Helianthus annuus]
MTPTEEIFILYKLRTTGQLAATPPFRYSNLFALIIWQGTYRWCWFVLLTADPM